MTIINPNTIDIVGQNLPTTIQKGSGIRNSPDINAAMLEKLSWNILTDPDNIWIRVVSAKYFVKKNFLEIKKMQSFINMEIFT